MSLTWAQKKQLVYDADHAGITRDALAQKWNVSQRTVRRLLTRDAREEIQRNAQQAGDRKRIRRSTKTPSAGASAAGLDENAATAAALAKDVVGGAQPEARCLDDNDREESIAVHNKESDEVTDTDDSPAGADSSNSDDKNEGGGGGGGGGGALADSASSVSRTLATPGIRRGKHALTPLTNTLRGRQQHAYCRKRSGPLCTFCSSSRQNTRVETFFSSPAS